MPMKLLILSGPSCVGKDPLLAALRRARPDLPLAEPVPYASRRPRPGEIDGLHFHFRDAETIRALDPARFFVYRLRDQWRALDWDELDRLRAESGRVVVQLTPAAVADFRAHPRLAAAEVTAVLLTPMDPAGADRESLTAFMRAAQRRRAERLGLPLDADLEVRAAAAFDEMQPAPWFDHVIVNRDPEGHPNWDHDSPLGDAGRAVAALAAILAAG